MRSTFTLSAILIATSSCVVEEQKAAAVKERPVKERPVAETQRGAYVLKYADANSVAGVLSKHFKGVAEIHAGPDSAGDCLLINAPPGVFEEIAKIIDQIDRRPRTIDVDVYFVELQAKTGDDKQSQDFTGPAADVGQRLNAMTRNGQVASVKRIHLGATEGQVNSVMIGENKPYVMGAAMTGRGNLSKQITYRNTGTQVRVTPSVLADGMISLELNIEDSSAKPSTTPSVGNDEKAAAIPAADFTNTSFKGKLVVASGRTVLANASKSSTKDGQAENLILVGARIEEPKAAKK